MIPSSPPDRTQADRTALIAATLVAGAMIAQQVASKAARDALFLGNFPVQRLPDMVLAAAILGLLLIIPMTRLLVAVGPSRFVPAAFLSSGCLLLVEWLFCRVSISAGAVLVYLHVAAIGPALVSGFWSLVNERFDPRTARRRMSRLVAGATLGGLLGGLVAERVGSTFGAVAILPVLAGLHVLCGTGVSRVRSHGFPAVPGVRGRSAPTIGTGDEGPPDPEASSTLEGVHLTEAGIAEAGVPMRRDPDGSGFSGGVRSLLRPGYLRHMAILVVLGTLAAGLLDYVLKVRASEAFANREDQLVRFFALFYTGTAFLTFLVQTTISRWLLERWGPSRAASALPAAVGLGSGGHRRGTGQPGRHAVLV